LIDSILNSSSVKGSQRSSKVGFSK
jgi:hypothetical protein